MPGEAAADISTRNLLPEQWKRSYIDGEEEELINVKWTRRLALLPAANGKRAVSVIMSNGCLAKLEFSHKIKARMRI
jgi:hypothetical protein